MNSLILLLPLLPTAQEPAVPIEVGVQEPAAIVRVVAVDPRGQRVALGDADGQVVLLDAADGRVLQELARGLGSSCWLLEFSPDGALLAAVSSLGRLVIWNLGEWDSLGQPRSSFSSGMLPDRLKAELHIGGKLLWSPTGEFLALGFRNGDMSLWSANGQLRRRWSVASVHGGGGSVRLVEPSGWAGVRGEWSTSGGDSQFVWAPDGGVLYVAHREFLQVRDGLSGALRVRGNSSAEPLSEDWITALDIHPDGKWLATGHREDCLRIWNLRTAELVHEARFPSTFAFEEPGSIAALAFSPNGQELAFSTMDGTIVGVVDLQSHSIAWKREFGVGHFYESLPICWSPDSAHLWFAFRGMGGSLHHVLPHSAAEPVLFGHAKLPSFGGRLGAIPSASGVLAVSFDGSGIWSSDKQD